MKEFINDKKVESFRKGEKVVDIYRCEKKGTKRVFFYPKVGDKRINTTLFSTKAQAVTLAKLWLNK